MKALSLIALAIVVYTPSAFGCSVDTLKKIAEEHLERFPSAPERQFAPPTNPRELDGAGGSWQVFERESGVPHSIVVKQRQELGQDIIRVSFLNRHDFIITRTSVLYADSVQTKEERTGKYLIGAATHYFFCEGKPVVPADTKNPDNVIDAAGALQKSIFEDGELKADLARVPQ
jgi:hypothetical protein